MPRARQNEFKTDAELRAIERNAVNVARTEWRDAEVRGLVFVTQPSGNCAWYLFYTASGGGPRKLRLGDYGPELSLKRARQLATEKRAEIIGGRDPVKAAKDAKTKSAGMTFQDLAERFLAENDRLSASTKRVYEYALKKDAYPLIGSKLVDEVSREDVIGVCQSIEKRVKIDPKTNEKQRPTAQSDHTRTTISAVFSWARQENLATHNPAQGIKKRGTSVARDREPTGEEIGRLWKGLNGSKVSKPMAIIIKLSILTGQRRTEVAGARVSELSLDGDAPTWTIPGDTNKRGKLIEGRTKNGLTQVVRLSRQAAELFKTAVAECSDGDYVFPADMSKVKTGQSPRTPHIHGESVSMAMRRLRAEAGVDDVSIHDMRRGISNWLKNEGVSREVRDIILNHKDQSVTEAHYTQNARMERQVSAAMQAWADRIWEVTGQAQQAPDNVMKFARG